MRRLTIPVVPAIVDTHTHMPVNREELLTALQRKAYYGVGVVMSLGQDTGDVALQVRNEMPPNGARLRTAGRGITMPEPGRTEAPYWVSTHSGQKSRKTQQGECEDRPRHGRKRKLGAPS